MPRPQFANQRPKRPKYEYIPPPTSGAHAILVSMLKAEEADLLKLFTKQQILDYCNRFSISGFKDSSKIWQSIKGLLDKSLIRRNLTREPTYYLTDEARDLARKLIDFQNGATSQDDGGAQSEPHQSEEELSNLDSNSCQPETVWADGEPRFELKAGTFEIVLIVDRREKISVISPDNSVKIDIRMLSCGDFIWVARPKNAGPHDKTRELVLDYVVERKRLDDLAASIFDGRFQQQKMRLINTGMRRPVYLIEDCGGLRATSLTSAGLAQAVVSILTQDGIDVEKVKNPSHANDYLISMTKCLERFFLNRDIRSCNQEAIKERKAGKEEFMTFSEFQTQGAKITNWTVREMFAKHLIQITGMSDKRVAVIIKHYPTISALYDAYERCADDKEKENLLSKLKIPDANRTIGPALSKRVCVTYT